VAPDYHTEIANHYYSVPPRLIVQEVQARSHRSLMFGHIGIPGHHEQLQVTNVKLTGPQRFTDNFTWSMRE
jgi:hypothetical protein